jgi:hypothetical protein
VPNVKQRVGIGTPLGEASPAQVLNLLTSGAFIELDNAWQIRHSRITGDESVQLLLTGMPANRVELDRYGLSEEIASYRRRWFVCMEEASEVLPRLATQRRPIRDAALTDPSGNSNAARHGTPCRAGWRTAARPAYVDTDDRQRLAVGPAMLQVVRGREEDPTRHTPATWGDPKLRL